MKGINKVILVGIVGKDPELRVVSDDFKVATFSFATTDSFKNKETGEWRDVTEWHNIECFRGQAEYVNKHITKGTAMYIEGKIKTTSYEKDGSKVYRTNIIADTISILKKKDEMTPGVDISTASDEDDDFNQLPF